MPRKLKPYFVETVTTRSGLSADINLDREEKLFKAEFGGVKYQDASEVDLKNKLIAAMRDYASLEWKAAIQVDFSGGKGHIGMSAKRFWWAKAHDGTLREAAGYDDPVMMSGVITKEKRMGVFYWRDEREFAPPIRVKDYNGRPAGMWYLPYSEVTWAGLMLIIDMINTLNTRMVEMLDSADGQDRIAAMGASMLGMLLPPGEAVEHADDAE